MWSGISISEKTQTNIKNFNSLDDFTFSVGIRNRRNFL